MVGYLVTTLLEIYC